MLHLDLRAVCTVVTIFGALSCSAGRTAASGDPSSGGSGGTAGSVPTGGLGGASTGTGGDGGFDLSVSSGTGAAGPGDCDDDTKGSVYILGQDKQFARFAPQTQDLTVLGTLNCPGEDFNTTFSMSVDRKGRAWVLFANGVIYHVNTKTLECTATGFLPCQSGFCTFGMGFVSDAPGSEMETLYVSGAYNQPGSSGLATIDQTTLTLTPIADYDVLAGKAAELTGTGDARLFGYFQDVPIRLAEINKADAKVITYSDLTQIPSGLSWAFAFWGGSFYIMSGTGIYKYEPTSQITTPINTNVGFDIVGAGVSTCAPTEEPK